MDGPQDRINVDLANALPSISRDMSSQLNARELSLASRNRALSSENAQLESRNNQLKSENQGLKLDIRSLEQEMSSRDSSATSVPGYAAGNEKGQMINDYF